MPLKAIIPPSAQFNNSRTTIKLPGEISTQIAVKVDEEGRYVFSIPFEIDMRVAIEKNYKFRIDIVSEQEPESVKLIDMFPRDIKEGSLEKLNMLPGQVNSKDPYVRRLKERNLVSENSKKIKDIVTRTETA